MSFLVRRSLTPRWTSPALARAFTLSHPVQKPPKGKKNKSEPEPEPEPEVDRSMRKSKSGKQAVEPIIPGSQQLFSDPADRLEHARAQEKMSATVDWFRRECATAETRANGRVTPRILDSVRVKTLNGDVKLEEIATVGVKEGSTLLITMFEEIVKCNPLKDSS